MKQSLQLRLSQQLGMTPQLQQAIRLLQLGTQELQTEIQEQLLTNPLLELAEPEREADLLLPESRRYALQWDTKFSRRIQDPEQLSELEQQQHTSFDLQDHLSWQVELGHFTEKDKLIAFAMIDCINEDGYLDQSLEEIHASLPKTLEVELDELLSVLRRIQGFDPVGIGARDLQECLALQLAELPEETPSLQTAQTLVEQYLHLLAKQDEGALCTLLSTTPQILKEAIHLIQRCQPRPGAIQSTQKAEYIIPDAFAYKVNGVWQVELNEDFIPELRIHADYAALLRRGDSSRDNQFLRNQLQEARWFLKSLHNRQETLLKVVRTIVHHQQAFLEQGEEQMRPLVLQTVAEEIGMHGSTISRVTTNKYLHTPRGIYELKYFFSSYVLSDSGDTCSATAIRAILKKLMSNEDPRSPLSDSKLCQLLEEQGIQVARRTVAKYREALQIPPSHERRRIV